MTWRCNATPAAKIDNTTLLNDEMNVSLTINKSNVFLLHYSDYEAIKIWKREYDCQLDGKLWYWNYQRETEALYLASALVQYHLVILVMNVVNYTE